jgi:hypothetical protein
MIINFINDIIFFIRIKTLSYYNHIQNSPKEKKIKHVLISNPKKFFLLHYIRRNVSKYCRIIKNQKERK